MTKRDFLASLKPVAAQLGARIVAPSRMRDSDIALRWHGAVVGGLRMPDLRDALPRLIRQVEKELGAELCHLDREAKQQAVRRLYDRGAFALRKSVEDVADAMGVSRMTIYTYLDVIQREGIS